MTIHKTHRRLKKEKERENPPLTNPNLMCMRVCFVGVYTSKHPFHCMFRKGECFHHFLIERRMVMEALRRTRRRGNGAGQSTKNDCSVRTVARSGKCQAVGSSEKWRRDRERGGDGEEVECLIHCSSQTKLGGEIFQSFSSCYCVAPSDSHKN